MPGKNTNKDKSMAAHLKKLGIVRNSGMCPWGCGRSVSNGGGALLVHLNVCKGRPKGAGR